MVSLKTSNRPVSLNLKHNIENHPQLNLSKTDFYNSNDLAKINTTNTLITNNIPVIMSLLIYKSNNKDINHNIGKNHFFFFLELYNGLIYIINVSSNKKLHTNKIHLITIGKQIYDLAISLTEIKLIDARVR